MFRIGEVETDPVEPIVVHDDRLINAGQQHGGRCSEKFHETNPSEITCRGEMPPRPTTIAKRWPSVPKRIIMLGLGQARFPPDKSSG